MNEQLQQALASILGKTMQGVEAGVSFLSTEIPDVIHQLLVWKMAQSSVYLSLYIIAAFVGILLICKSYKTVFEYQRGSHLYYGNSGELEKEGKRLMDEYGAKIPFSIIGCAAGFMSIIFLLVGGVAEMSTVIQIWLAPKIYLIEYAASLAK